MGIITNSGLDGLQFDAKNSCQPHNGNDMRVQSCNFKEKKLIISGHVFHKPLIKAINAINGASHFHIKTLIYEKLEQNWKT